MSNQHNPVFPAIELPQFIDEKLPNVVRARLHHPKADALPDVAAATVDALKNSAKLASLPAGARVAITCGSRGIKSKPAVVKATVSWLKERGFQPFIVPAMGSHGGARAESQVVLLGELGYTEEAMGCPIHSSMAISCISSRPNRPMSCGMPERSMRWPAISNSRVSSASCAWLRPAHGDVRRGWTQ